MCNDTAPTVLDAQSSSVSWDLASFNLADLCKSDSPTISDVSVVTTPAPTTKALPRRRDAVASLPFLGRYVAKSTIGKGAQGKVKVAADASTGQDVAIKLVSKSSEPGMLAHSRKEAALLNKIPNHPNICNIIETAETTEHLAMIVELGVTDMYRALEVKGGSIGMDAARRIVKQILEALQHCHAHGVAHRDIKPENILLFGSSDPSTATAKLCDFGLAKDFTCAPGCLLASQVGTQAYVAPEILEGLTYDGRAADIFSLGVTLFNFATGFEPWASAVRTDVVYDCYVSTPDEFWRWAHRHSSIFLDEKFESLFSTMCNIDPTHRPSATACLSHPFFTDP